MVGQAEAVDSFLKEVGKQTWELFRKDPVAHVLAMLVVSVLSVLSLGIALGPLLVGYLGMVQRSSRGEQVSFDQVFSGFSQFVPALVLGLLIGVGVCIGSLLLVLPGVAFAVFTCLAFPALAYAGLGPVEAIKHSFALVRDNLVNVVAMLIVAGILQSIGGAVLFGLILTGPLSMIALAVTYERISNTGALSANAGHGYTSEVRAH